MKWTGKCQNISIFLTGSELITETLLHLIVQPSRVGPSILVCYVLSLFKPDWICWKITGLGLALAMISLISTFDELDKKVLTVDSWCSKGLCATLSRVTINNTIRSYFHMHRSWLQVKIVKAKCLVKMTTNIKCLYMYVNVANRTAEAISYVVKRITILINVRYWHLGQCWQTGNGINELMLLTP